jgi:Rieske Fe-S protein
MESAGSPRRGFLKAVTLAIGGAIGAVLGVPLLRIVLYPLGRRTVTSAAEPIDVAAAAAVVAGAPPLRVSVIARSVRDAWAVTPDVPLGAAWLARAADGELFAFSAVCPHLGCAVDFDAKKGSFACPCHESAFSPGGDRLAGPAKRGLDPLPVAEKDGRVLVTFKRYRTDVAEREEV